MSMSAPGSKNEQGGGLRSTLTGNRCDPALLYGRVGSAASSGTQGRAGTSGVSAARTAG